MRNIFILLLMLLFFILPFTAHASLNVIEYSNQVDKIVKANWDPGQYRKNIITAVEVDIDANGFIKDIRIKDKSEYELFNQYIELSLQQAEPFPAPGEDVTVQLMFSARDIALRKHTFKENAVWFFANLILF